MFIEETPLMYIEIYGIVKSIDRRGIFSINPFFFNIK